MDNFLILWKWLLYLSLKFNIKWLTKKGIQAVVAESDAEEDNFIEPQVLLFK